MKKLWAILLSLLLLCPCLGGWAEAAAAPGVAAQFQETFMQASTLGDAAAYVLDQQGTLWAWPYDEGEPQAYCELPPYPWEALSGGKAYEALSPADQAAVAQTVQVLAEAGGVLYGINQFAGRIGTVDAQGLHWQGTFDASLLLSSQGEQRFIMDGTVMDNTLYILESDWESGRENAAQVAALNLQTGESRLINAPDGARNLCAYQGELLLLCGNEQRSWLAAMNPATGETRELPWALAAGEAGGLAYDAATDTLALLTEQGLLTAQGRGEFTLIANNPMPYVSFFIHARYLPDGRYALAGDGIRVLSFSAGAGEQASLVLNLGNGMGRELTTAFQAAYPDVLMDIRTQEGLNAAAVAEAIRSGDGETDVYCIQVDSGFGRLVAKGYAAPLDANAAIAASAADMYPAIRSAVTNSAGQVIAYPISLNLNLWTMNQELWAQYFPGETPPTTWQALFEAMLRFEEAEEDDENLFLMEWSYEPMVKTVLHAFIQQKESQGKEVDFTDASLRETLALLSQVNDSMLAKGISYLFEGDVHPESEVLGLYSIFAQGGSGYGTGKASLDRYDGLPPFTFGEGETPTIRGYMYALVVNPLSQRQELAREFVALAASPQSSLMRYYILHASATEPVENENWQERLAEARQQREALEEKLAACDPADKRQLEDDLAVARSREAWREGDRWKVSAQGIAGWQATVPALSFFEKSPLISDEMEAQLDPLITRYGAGQLDLDGLLRQIGEVARQIYLEQGT